MTATARKPRPKGQTQAPPDQPVSRQGKVDARTPVQTDAYAQAVRRMIRALVVRADGGDLEALTELTNIRHLVTDCLTGAARTLHDSAGYSWAEIGRAAGISKQAAASRWGGEQ